jgi:hypothetical protein
MDYEEIDRMYMNASEADKKIVKRDVEAGDKFAAEIFTMVEEDDSGIKDVLQYPELRGFLSMVIKNSEVLETAMLNDFLETARALQLLMYAAIIFERQQVAAKAELNEEVKRILKENK